MSFLELRIQVRPEAVDPQSEALVCRNTASRTMVKKIGLGRQV
jgi:hypothetical protein